MTIEFITDDFRVIEDMPAAEVIIVRRGETANSEATVTLALEDETATAPNDYDNSTRTVSFAAFERSKTVNLPIFEDREVEDNETIRLLLTNSIGEELGSLNEATVTIIDNDDVSGGTISGFVWKDFNRNGVRDPREMSTGFAERGKEDVVIYLDRNNNGRLDFGSESEPFTTTDRAGNYQFTNLPEGNYAVRSLITSGLSSINPNNGLFEVSLVAAETVSGINFGIGGSPRAVRDNAATEENKSVTINVLDNDLDLEGGSIQLVRINTPSNGTVKRLDEDLLEYSPNPGFTGQDRFSYLISDSDGNIDKGWVQVRVDADRTPTSTPTVNPVDDSFIINANSTIILDVLANDLPNDGTLKLASFGLALNGTVSRDRNGTENDNTDDKIIYSPNPGFLGTDRFSYVTEMNGILETATVTVMVGTASNSILEELETDFPVS